MINHRTNGPGSAAVISAWVIFIAALTTLAGAEILDFGFFKSTESFHGPFRNESSQTAYAFAVGLGKSPTIRQLFTTAGDTPDAPSRSNLRLWINGQPAGPAHALHAEIRNQGGGRYSHWGNVLLFSLPPDTINEAGTTAVVEYSLRLQNKIYSFGWLGLVLSSAFLTFRAWQRDPESLRRKAALSARSASAGALALFSVAAVATATYLVTIVIGFGQGYALPNTAVFQLLPWTRQLAIYEPTAQYLIVLVAMVGAALSWLSPSAFQKNEAGLIRCWTRYGLLVVAALFLFSLGATWSGIARREDLQTSAMGGLIPFIDAHGYFDMTFMQVITGHWEPLLEQRPLAAAHRALMMFLAGYSNVRFLLLQALAIAAVTYAATRSVMHWRGLWAGMTFFGLALALVRPYLTTHLTEPLGLFWVLLSLPFLIRLLRDGSLVDGAVSFLTTTLSLLTRMGSMFTIPAFAVWLVWTQARNAKRLKFALVTIAAVLLGCSLMSVILLRLYGSGSGFLGSNFSSVICGATHGGDWTVCESMYRDDLRKLGAGFSAEQAHYLYAKAWEGFRREPSIFFGRLIEGERVFLENLVQVSLGGYTMRGIPRWFPWKAWALMAAFGLAITLWLRRERSELSFWLFMWLGLLTSAPLVIFADGWRILSSVLPFVAVFFACGFATRQEVASAVPTENRTPRLALAGLLVTMSLWIVTPGMAHRLDPIGAAAFRTVQPNAGERVVLGSRHMAGFIVVPDDQAVPRDVASMRRSDFIQAFEYSGNGMYQKLNLPPPSVAFAFVAAPNTNGTDGSLFLAPPEVLARRDVLAWRLTLETPSEEGRGYWFRVSEANPVVLPLK